MLTMFLFEEILSMLSVVYFTYNIMRILVPSNLVEPFDRNSRYSKTNMENKEILIGILFRGPEQAYLFEYGR